MKPIFKNRFELFALAGLIMISLPKANAITLSKEQQAKRAVDYQNMLDELHITQPLRKGVSYQTGKPNSANYDENKANIYPKLPDPLKLKNGRKVTSSSLWMGKRRKEIIEDFDREVYGRVPANVPSVIWHVDSITNETENNIPVIVKHITGHVDNSFYKAVNVNIGVKLIIPANVKGPVPVILSISPGLDNSGMPPESAKELLAKKGWGSAIMDVLSIQDDNGAGLTQGIIGLVNKGRYRKPDDWGVLRAWAWGAQRTMDYLQTDKSVNEKAIGIEGLSRYGKTALIAMAYDSRFAVALIGSSGAGGAKLHRRNYGELVENITDINLYHWMAGNYLKYAGPLNWNDLPVDSHELIALCAPRPVFISSGMGVAPDGRIGNDAWADPKGMFMAAVAAGPVYRLLGKKTMTVYAFPEIETMVDGVVAFRQHSGGHTDEPNWPFFLKFADKYMK